MKVHVPRIDTKIVFFILIFCVKFSVLWAFYTMSSSSSDGVPLPFDPNNYSDPNELVVQIQVSKDSYIVISFHIHVWNVKKFVVDMLLEQVVSFEIRIG